MKSNGTTREPRRTILIPLVIGCAFFMEGLDSTMIAVAIPDMAESLGEHPLRLNLVITTYLLSLAVFIPLSGWIADRLGARVVFCAAIAIFAIGSALCGLSTSLPMMLLTRVVQGLGGAMMTPVGRLILLRSFPRSGLVSAMNWMTIPAMIGPTVGPIVGGFLTTYFSWRAIFYLNVPIGIAGFVLTLYLIDNYRAPAPTRFDLRGFFLAGLGLAFLEIAIENLGRPIIPAGLGAMLVRTVSGAFLRTFGFRRLLVGTAVLAALVTAACGLLRPETPVWVIVALLLLSGCVRSIQYLALNTVSYADVPPPLLSK